MRPSDMTAWSRICNGLFAPARRNQPPAYSPGPMAMDGGADKIVVSMWRTDRVVVDLDRREEDLVECLVGTNFSNNGVNQLTAPLGFRVHEGTRLESQSYANPVPRNGLPCGRNHVDV